LGCLFSREFQALLDLNSLTSSELNVAITNISEWGVKGLMASAFLVENVFANHFPVIKLKDRLTEYVVGVKQAIQDESVNVQFKLLQK
jgi:hypothetical protein